MIRIRPVQRCFKRSFFNATKPQNYQVSKTLNGSPSQVYDIVSRVDLYKQFVPFVEDSYVSEYKDGVPQKAGLKVGWKDIVEQFDCELECIENRKVLAKSVELDLFEFLETQWLFHEHGKNQCKIEFQLLYKFRNPIYDRLSFMFAPQVTTIMIGAFEKRLHQFKRHQWRDRLKQ